MSTARAWLLTVALVAVGAGVAPAPSGAAGRATGSRSVSFTYTGSPQTWTVPAGVSSIAVDAFGASGGDAVAAEGGGGGVARATIAVTPGEVLTVVVGGEGRSQGFGGFNGGGHGGSAGGTGSSIPGGGGGASDVRRGSTRLVVGGGGGGAGAAALPDGGAGGGPAGTNGQGKSCFCFGGGMGGTGGTQLGAGTGGQGGYCDGCGKAPGKDGSPGAAGVGGAGGAASEPNGGNGGGGGGGWFGGGGGGGDAAQGGGTQGYGNGGAGGGGSSYGPGGTVFTNGVRDGNGLVTITHTGEPGTQPGAPAAPTVTAATSETVTLAWTAPPAGSSPVTGYTITVFVENGSVPAATISTGSTALTRVVTGVPAGNRYRFKVGATSAAGTGPASAYSADAIPPFRTIAAFTDQQLRDFAGRAATTAEQSAWRSALIGGTSPPTQVAKATGFSTWAPKVDPVTRLYYAYFQRPPDTGGLSYWSGRLRSGATAATVSASFAGSKEFRDQYGPLSNLAFVQRVYQNVLGRAGDAGGVSYWKGQLDSGAKNRGQVMVGFSEGAEHTARRAGEVATVSVIFGMLRRAPTASELASWTGPSRSSRTALIAVTMRSAAYDART